MLHVNLPSSVLSVTEGVVAFGRGARRGSGLVIGPEHVVTVSARLAADTVETVLADGRRLDGRVAGVDPRVGVAVIEVATGRAAAPAWSASPPAIGTAVFALGDPGTGVRVTAGAVSAGPLTMRVHDRPLELIEHTALLP